MFDLRGLLAPVLASLRLNTRRTSKAVSTWDKEVTADLRQKWVKNFWILEQLRGLGFQRAMMPEVAVNNRARAIALMDAALEICMMGVWIGFQIITGGWSCQLHIARSALADGNVQHHRPLMDNGRDEASRNVSQESCDSDLTWY